MKVYYHQGKTGGGFIRQCIALSKTNCLFARQPEDIYNSNVENYEYCYIHSKKAPEMIKALKAKLGAISIYTCIRHPVSGFISSVKHARRENNYTILPVLNKIIFGAYTDLRFSEMSDELKSTKGDGLNVHHHKIHGAGTYLNVLLNTRFQDPRVWLQRYTYNLSLGREKDFVHNHETALDIIDGSGKNKSLILGPFKYIGLYELFPELLERLSQEGFIDYELIKKDQVSRVNVGVESSEDEISHDLAIEWLKRYPSDFIIWEYLYGNSMKAKYGMRSH